jgi:pimeloyl-ACP methyl ester carboxylesterase
MSFLRNTSAKCYDGISFGMINLLHLRNAAGKHTAGDMEAYVERWASASLEDYYAVPADAAPPDLPSQGHRHLASPHRYDCEENNRVSLEYWPGPKGWQSPVMFMLHGVMSVSDAGYKGWARKLNSLGWGAIFFHLPYHYGRKPAQALSGEMALTANLIRTAEGIRQAVIELRWVSRELYARGVPHIGLWGTSYGGWVGSLLAVLDDHILTAMLLEPIVDVDLAIWESPATRILRRQLKRRGITRDLVRRHLRLVCPTHHDPKLGCDKILLAAGTFDRIAPPDSIRALHREWKGSHYLELPQGHVGYQLMPESLKWATNKWPELFEG